MREGDEMGRIYKVGELEVYEEPVGHDWVIGMPGLRDGRVELRLPVALAYGFPTAMAARAYAESWHDELVAMARDIADIGEL